MMRSIKAIVVGCLFVIVVILLMQLVYIFVAVGYNALAKYYPLLNDISGVFRYIIGIPVFIAIMFAGGYITAAIASVDNKMTVLLYCMTVGFITVGGMMYTAVENSSLTLTGIVVFILALVATTAGGLYWHKGQKFTIKTVNMSDI